MLPSVSITKVANNIGNAPPSNVGLLAIAASSQLGTANVPTAYARSDLALNDLGYGPLVEYGAYTIDVANQPFIACKTTTAIPASYGTVVHTGVLGTSVPSAGATAPLEHYAVQVNIIAPGTVGTAGITYTYSLDGGGTVSGIQALGTSATLTIPNSGVSFALGAGTLLAGDTWSVFTERALANNGDLPATFTALAQTRQPWEGVLLDCVVDTATVGLVDTWLAGLEGSGQFKFALLNLRFKNEPQPATESESAYATFAAGVVATQACGASLSVGVGADGGHVASPLTGLNLKRPTSMLVAARAMKITIGTDPAYVATGNLAGTQIANGLGNPLDHDENLFPTLDPLRLMSLRSFAAGGPEGVYITNANILQPSGDDFPYLQFARVMNRACTIAWSILTTELSRGVNKNPKPDPVTGAVYIFPPDAAAIEQKVNGPLKQALKGEVSSVLFSLSRTDDLSVIPAIVHGLISIVAKAYIKSYTVTAEFSKAIQVAA